jgi:hypothetical protein
VRTRANFSPSNREESQPMEGEEEA